MQARRGRAALVSGGERAERLTEADELSGDDRGRDRVVGRPQSAGMLHADDAPVRDHAHERHRPGTGGEHGLVR